MVRMDGEIEDEIDHYENCRSIGALEAASRLLSLPQCERFPSVQPLAIHLANENLVVFSEEGARQVAENPLSGKTQLTEFFATNGAFPGTRVKYCDFPESFWCYVKSKKWLKTKSNNGTFGRVYTVHPSASDRFYLRMLLHHEHCKGLVFDGIFVVQECTNLLVFRKNLLCRSSHCE